MPDLEAEFVEFALYAFATITHVGNLSKLFDSPNAYKKTKGVLTLASLLTAARCQQLRDALDVRRDMLMIGRDTRNYIEHYDERLEDWLRKPDRKILFDMCVEDGSRRRQLNERSVESLSYYEERDYHRYYDPSHHSMNVNNHVFHLSKALNEVSPLRVRATKWLEDQGFPNEVK